jgi:hypothetical protein
LLRAFRQVPPERIVADRISPSLGLSATAPYSSRISLTVLVKAGRTCDRIGRV